MDARLAPALCGVAPGSELLIFTFHSLFESKQETEHGTLDPQQGITTSMFRSFVADFHEHGYRFVSPAQIAAGLDPSGHYAMITFDDGYANNLRALAVLEEFAAPAVFCISANHVATGKPFWWDVLYRQAIRRSWPEEKLERTRTVLKRLRTEDAEARLAAELGGRELSAAAFRTVSNLDRPFRSGELRKFARHPLVHIGNHTWDHAILTNYSAAEVETQIERAQAWLTEFTGEVPRIIAYPNGDVSAEIEKVVKDLGLQFGMTIRAGKNPIPRAFSTRANLRLRRYTLRGDRDIAEQCAIARSGVSLQAAVGALRSAATAKPMKLWQTKL
jgi:peptidoglycan/xylan/chitin deacetylase (PgdA/CDA1 family)